jgi:hypothetical protein
MQNKYSEGTPSLFDDFATLTGSLGWTATSVAGVVQAAGTLSLLSLMQGAGGSMMTPAAATAGLSQQQLLAYAINPNSTTGGLGIQMEANVLFDTALSTATNAYVYLFGMADGTTSASNFVGLSVGWNPVTNAASTRWALVSDTVAHIVGNTAASPYVEFGVSLALDVVQSLKVRISPDWKTIQGFVNGVAAPLMAVGSPYGGATSVVIPPGVAYKPTFICDATVSAAQTGIIVTDCVELSLIGRPTRG